MHARVRPFDPNEVHTFTTYASDLKLAVHSADIGGDVQATDRNSEHALVSHFWPRRP